MSVESTQSDSLQGRPSRGQRAWRWFARAELGPLLALIGLIVLFTVADYFYGGGRFASIRNLRIVLNQTSIVAVAALGMTIVIIAGGIDLSAGTAMTLCGAVLAYFLLADYHPVFAVTMAVVVGCACGLTNGILISTLRIAPFIVTLGMMTIYLGIGEIICDEKTISPGDSQIPFWITRLCSTRPPNVYFGWIPNIPPGVILAGILGTIVAAVLKFTVFGRHVFAIGSNESTARLCGVNIPLTKILVYTVAGFFMGIAGIYHFATVKNGNPGEGIGQELQVIAAVVIGGGSLAGGRGSILGALTGAAIMAVLRSGCDQLLIPNPYQQITIGAIIIAAVAVDRFRQPARQ